ncbi:regulator of gluconeogenesis Rmd5 [Cordyceps fumosorosea ARSEF 2679]|uniref:GID complex catalytic subunit 2 n=1 Tax=Cordyceps fumosorosea (strain ARSEF 2679) TaxID=1081104 RepID=A0A167V0H0_CORFA|nr:regulator of gluconeogenesis Rmd5 [Cordyceps fumosorosea ARSEF 2679]OAA62093.1 regulator of gluconeogenesis Rmd5 [Cordyceps fumosorosea ARSEF 2679]
MADDTASPFGPLLLELARMRKSTLSAAIDDVDKIIDLLTAAREQVAAEDDSHRTMMALTTLQNPVKSRLEAINTDLKDVNKAQKAFGKALDKALPQRHLPMETDAMADQSDLINRAIVMHLLREGQFDVASTFVREARDNPLEARHSSRQTPTPSQVDADGDDDMDGPDGHEDDDEDDEDEDEYEDDFMWGKDDHDSFESITAQLDGRHGGLQEKFSEMYDILSELRQHNLSPAIRWAHDNNTQLEAKGSNLEFELCKLQFVWLFRGPAVNGLPDDGHNGHEGALLYARQHFGRFQARHLREIQQLCCALVFAGNLEASPYSRLFRVDTAFEEVSASFTREFCSLLGLAAESPLYVAVTAGAIALPRLIKYTTYMREKKTEWTTENELAFETPLPPSMIYHPIFVCPVSKEQTTEANPPMLLPCGHVICHDSLKNIAKGSRCKCPYCPTEGHIKDAIRITL